MWILIDYYSILICFYRILFKMETNVCFYFDTTEKWGVAEKIGWKNSGAINA